MSRVSNFNPVHYSSEDHTYETPPWLLQAVLDVEERDQFDMDACCTWPNVPAKMHNQQPEIDGLAVDWAPLTWINPEYGTSLKHRWMPKILTEAEKGCRIWALLPTRTDTEWMLDALRQAAFIYHIRRKVVFYKNGEPFRIKENKRNKTTGVLEWTGKMVEGPAPFPVCLAYFDSHDQEGQAYRLMRRMASLFIGSPDKRLHGALQVNPLRYGLLEERATRIKA